MISVSDAWKDIQHRFLLPETFVEVSCTITEIGAQDEAVASGTIEEVFSDVGSIPGTSGEQTIKHYATLEPNLWALDGTRNILPDSGPYTNTGYVSNIAQTGSVKLTLPEVRTAPIPGVSITWSSEYGEYPHVFTVTAKNGDTVVAETTVIDNASNKSLIYMEIANYDSIEVTIHNWSMPDHRSRVDSLKLGLDLTFTKNDILSFTHEQHSSIVTGELPKNSIEFSINNTDNRWNPSNPSGLERYLSERQKLTVRYGLDIGGTTEWIKGGTFYLSEWRAPSNGLEASFAARDMLEYMLNETYTGVKSGTLLEIANAAVAQADLPAGDVVSISETLENYSATLTKDYTIAEILQMCANAACCVMYQDRMGVLRIEPYTAVLSGEIIPASLSYSYPEIELSKNLKSVSVAWGDSDESNNTYLLPVAASGETQTVTNPLVASEAHAIAVAEWIKRNLESRKSINGEYRCDPRLDVFDCVTVESKFGPVSPVVITNIKYNYSGAFRGSYTGRIMA